MTLNHFLFDVIEHFLTKLLIVATLTAYTGMNA